MKAKNGIGSRQLLGKEQQEVISPKKKSFDWATALLNICVHRRTHVRLNVI